MSAAAADGDSEQTLNPAMLNVEILKTRLNELPAHLYIYIYVHVCMCVYI